MRSSTFLRLILVTVCLLVALGPARATYAGGIQ